MGWELSRAPQPELCLRAEHRGGPLSPNQLYKDPCACLQDRGLVPNIRQDDLRPCTRLSLLPLPLFPSRQDRSGNSASNLQTVKFYSPSYSERTGLQDCHSNVVINMISRERSTREGSSHHLEPANSQKAFLERGSLYSLCDGEERSYHWWKLSVMGGFFTYAS